MPITPQNTQYQPSKQRYNPDNKVYTNTQPLLWPAIYMVSRMAQCRKVVILDKAQFHRKGHHARTSFYRDGMLYPYSLPVARANRKPLDEVELFEPELNLHRMTSTIRATYKDEPYFDQYFPMVQEIIDSHLVHHRHTGKPVMLLDLAMDTTNLAFELLAAQVYVEFFMASEVLSHRADTPSAWMAALGVAINCNTYLTSQSSLTEYIVPEDFYVRGVSLLAQNYVMPQYRQWEEPTAQVSYLDVLFKGGVSGLAHVVL